jgi:hypothetical protein
MRTTSGFEVEKPREVLFGFVREEYDIYDGVKVAQDNELRVVEIALSAMLNSRISGNTGGEIWRKERTNVEEALAEIRAGVDLLEIPEDAPIPDEPAIGRAVTAICRVPWSKLSVATKILHKKRPGLIPILDSVVEGHYWPRWCPTERGRSWGDYAIALTRLIHRDIVSVAGELQEFRCALRERGTPLSGCRILDVLMWAVLSGNETYYRDIAKQG